MNGRESSASLLVGHGHRSVGRGSGEDKAGVGKGGGWNC